MPKPCRTAESLPWAEKDRDAAEEGRGSHTGWRPAERFSGEEMVEASALLVRALFDW